MAKTPYQNDALPSSHQSNNQQHPLSAAFPGMTKADLSALTDDIAEEGQREPITIYQDMILDGWHRYQACVACGRVPITVELPTGVDPVAFVKSHNLFRRHLTGSQRAEAVVACADWAKVGRPGNSAPGTELTAKTMAKEAEVGTRTVEHAKAAHVAGLGEAVRDGKITAKQGAAIAKLPEDQRQAAIENPAIMKATSAKVEAVLVPAAVDTLPPRTEQPDVEMVTIAKDAFDQLNSTLAEVMAENESLGKILDTDDRTAAAPAEIKRLTSKVASLESRLDELLIGKNDAEKSARSWMKKFQSLEKKTTVRTVDGMPI